MRTFNIKEEYSERFDEIRKASMEQSFYKYGPVKANYGVSEIPKVTFIFRRSSTSLSYTYTLDLVFIKEGMKIEEKNN